MTTAELWRVADLTPTSCAHLVAYERDGVRATACNWVPTRPGVVINRTEMLTLCRFACVRCMRTAAKRSAS